MIKERENLKKELEKHKEENKRKRIDMSMDWEHEQNIIKEKNEILKQKLEEAKKFKKDAVEKNKELVEKKGEHEKQVKTQKLDKARLIENNKKAKIEFLRNEENMIEYQTLTFKQSKKIQELKEEIKELNQKFPDEVAKYTKELEFLKFDNESKKSELEFMYQNYCDILRVRHKESKKLRRLLQLVMDQRSELEHFFIEAITTVDKARLEKIEMEGAMKRDGKILNPLLTTMRTRGHFKPKMTWAEREKVLRIVFSKINSGEMPLYWREIDVDDLKNELVKDDDDNIMTREEIGSRLRNNIPRPEIEEDEAPEGYAVQEISEEFEREYGDSKIGSVDQ